MDRHESEIFMHPFTSMGCKKIFHTTLLDCSHIGPQFNNIGFGNFMNFSTETVHKQINKSQIS